MNYSAWDRDLSGLTLDLFPPHTAHRPSRALNSLRQTFYTIIIDLVNLDLEKRRRLELGEEIKSSITLTDDLAIEPFAQWVTEEDQGLFLVDFRERD